MDASEIYSKRLNAKEVVFLEEKEEFIFPIADGQMDESNSLEEIKPIRGESHLDFLGEPEGSLPPPHDSFLDAEDIDDF